jgi:putative endonuclease
MESAELGRWGEMLARQHLISKGYQLKESNWRVPEGEIDLVFRDGETVVFVEVKARSHQGFGLPEESLTRRKQDRLIDLAWRYLQSNDMLDADWRIDVIAIEGTPSRGPSRLAHYENAVTSGPDL